MGRVLSRRSGAAGLAALVWFAAGTPGRTEAAGVDGPACAEATAAWTSVKDRSEPGRIAEVAMAAAEKGCGALVEAMLDAGVAPTLRDARGATMLQHAARGGHADLVDRLLKRGADPGLRDAEGATALFAAIVENRKAVAERLLAGGADPNQPGRAGATPLVAAAFMGDDQLVAVLLARRADPRLRDDTGKAPLAHAVERGFVAIVERLLDAGVDPNATLAGDQTALHVAAGLSDDVPEDHGDAVADLLVARGAKVDVPDARGMTPLMIAAEAGHAQIVTLLLAAGADKTLKDRQGRTAESLAADDVTRSALSR